MARQATAKKNGAQPSGARYDEQKEIEKLAYQYFVERGLDHGYDREDWLRAEAVVKSRRS
jgi:hypothetical protein